MNKQKLSEYLITCLMKSKNHYYDMKTIFEDFIEPLVEKIYLYGDDTFQERYDNMRRTYELNNELFIALHFKQGSVLYIYYAPTEWLWLSDEELKKAVTNYSNAFSNFW